MRITLNEKAVRRLLARMNWSEGRFALEIGVTSSAVSKWLKGDLSPSPANRQRIMVCLGQPFKAVFVEHEGDGDGD